MLALEAVYEHQGKGAITATSQTGQVRSQGTLVLQSNSDGVGSEALTLSAGTNVSFIPASTLLGGTDRQSDIQIRSATNGSATLTSLSARSLPSATGSDPYTNGIVRNAAIGFLDQVNLINRLSVQGTNNISAVRTAASAAFRRPSSRSALNEWGLRTSRNRSRVRFSIPPPRLSSTGILCRPRRSETGVALPFCALLGQADRGQEPQNRPLRLLEGRPCRDLMQKIFRSMSVL